MGAVEAQLMCVVRRRIKGYQLQDLRCSKCKQVPSPLHLPPLLAVSPSIASGSDTPVTDHSS